MDFSFADKHRVNLYPTLVIHSPSQYLQHPPSPQSMDKVWCKASLKLLSNTYAREAGRRGRTRLSRTDQGRLNKANCNLRSAGWGFFLLIQWVNI